MVEAGRIELPSCHESHTRLHAYPLLYCQELRRPKAGFLFLSPLSISTARPWTRRFVTPAVSLGLAGVRRGLSPLLLTQQRPWGPRWGTQWFCHLCLVRWIMERTRQPSACKVSFNVPIDTCRPQRLEQRLFAEIQVSNYL